MPTFFFSLGVPERDRASIGVFASVLSPPPSSSSTPNESLGVPTLRFFFFTGALLLSLGVDALY
jgi:hypothetical protein